MKSMIGILGVMLVAVGCHTGRPAQETVWLESKAIEEATYDGSSQTLSLVFPNGATYAYARVPRGHFDGLRTAERPGAYFQEHIRKQYATTRVQ